MKWFLPLFFLLTIFYFIFPLKAYASTSCQPIYGGGQSCTTINNILIEKTVLNPQTGKFVDNLGVKDPKYQPGFIVTFQIKITNIGNRDFSKVEIKDIFPQYVLFSAGPGIFDTNTKILTFSINNLKVQESRIFTISGRVVDSASIPFTRENVCVVNQALATTNTNEVAQDNSQFCIEKNVVATQTPKGGFPIFSAPPITTTPSTGPESLVLFSLIPAGITGWFMIKKSKKSNLT